MSAQSIERLKAQLFQERQNTAAAREVAIAAEKKAAQASQNTAAAEAKLAQESENAATAEAKLAQESQNAVAAREDAIAAKAEAAQERQNVAAAREDAVAAKAEAAQERQNVAAAREDAVAAKAEAAQERRNTRAAKRHATTAEAELEREKKMRKRDQEAYQEAMEKHQHLTFQQLLAMVYHHLMKNYPPPKDPPGGGYTKVNRCRYPNIGLPWEGGEEKLREKYLILQEKLEGKLFSISSHDLQRDGESVRQMQPGPEQVDVVFGGNAIEVFIALIINKLLEDDEMKAKCNCTSITFSKHSKDCAACADYDNCRSRIRPDGVVKRTGEEDGCFLVYEYKAGHKFPSAMLKTHLTNENLFSEEADDAHRRQELKKSGEKPDKRSPEQARAFGVASVGVQGYNYMLHCGVEYGFLSAGDSTVLFHVRKEDPKILYQKVLEPHMHLPDVAPEEWTMEQLFYTPLAQLTCFTLLALQADPPSKDEYQEMMRQTGDRLWPYPPGATPSL